MENNAKIMDGILVSTSLKNSIQHEVEKFVGLGNARPHLAAVMIGENPASQSYIRNKLKSCEEVGFRSTLITPDANISQEELLKIITDLNVDESVDGYIVQLPLPKHINETTVTFAINHEKDVDGFHPMNVGKMALGMPSFIPATPLGILEMLKFYNITTVGKKVVVVGRSNIVGTPLSILLSRKGFDATVTLVHSKTENLMHETSQADILIAAIGIPYFVKENMVKKGAVVIDVGINRVEAPETKSGYKLVGDVAYEDVVSKCSYITPVPKGVGPMTVAVLMLNTLQAYKKKILN
ncbi:MAG: bifunctional 5,10-methylenetetrahydrofolate dehydrogenase/5,10-methenyltetrahydrofolate cyclohydrolase [Saprospiraceae bacterium]|nr:bifunctional 5,10-methylenetetrahydrofolate dehydrogenase/5,10-methenyltetrahydrofolate cyclohydrolase [Saprospiraceae bacterium]